MAISSGLSSLARALMRFGGEPATLTRKSVTDPGEVIFVAKDEKPSRLPSQFKTDVVGEDSQEPVYFITIPPLVLPSPFTDPWEWVQAKFGRGAKFTCGHITYTVKRIIPQAPQGIVVFYQLVCNT